MLLTIYAKCIDGRDEVWFDGDQDLEAFAKASRYFYWPSMGAPYRTLFEQSVRGNGRQAARGGGDSAADPH